MAVMPSYRNEARLFGAFFLISFLAYGIGTGLIESVLTGPDVLASVHLNKWQIGVGAILMAVIHTFTNIGLPIVLRPVLMPHNEKLYLGYFSAAVTATVILVIGVIFLLLLLPLSDLSAASDAGPSTQFDALATLMRKGNYFSYQIGMAIWGLGGLMLCAILYQAKLIPRMMSVWGLLGYGIFITGSVLELFGFGVGVLLSAPGGLFELALSLWLIIRGFRTPFAS